MLGHPCGRKADTGLPSWGPSRTALCPSLSHTLTHLPQPQQSSTIPFPSQTSPGCNMDSICSRHELPWGFSSRSPPAFDSLQQFLHPLAGTGSPQPICGSSIPPHAGSQAGCGASARGRKYYRSHTSAFTLLLKETVLTHSPSSLFFPPPAAQWEFSLLLHLPQPSEGRMLCNVCPREGKLSHGVGHWGPFPCFSGGGQGRSVSEPGLTRATWPEDAPRKQGWGAAGCLPAADLVAMAGNKPAWNEREENV